MSRQVLIIDDDEYDRLALTRALSRLPEPIELSHATSGIEGLAKLQDTHFDAAIVDYQLHDMTADDLVERLKATVDPLPAIIIVTGQGDFRKVTHIMQSGAHDYLLKDDMTPERIERALTNAWRAVEKDNELKRQRSELIRSNAELEQYALLASHDLRAPLRSIRGFLELLQERTGGVIDDESAKYVQHAIDGANQLSRYVHGLLQVSRLQNTPGELAVFSSQSVLDDTVSTLQGLIAQASATIHLGNLPPMIGERQYFLQVMQNLVSNALIYRREGQDAEIHVSTRYDSPMPAQAIANLPKNIAIWQWTVTDNGRGIVPEKQSRVFDMFQSIDQLGNETGAGIGLAVCRKIVSAYGGKIWLDDAHREGCQFHFTWPGPSPAD